MSAVAFTAVGILGGLGQAALLWRAAALRHGAPGWALRLGLVGGILVVASLTGGIVPAASGWAVGFASGVALVARRTAS